MSRDDVAISWSHKLLLAKCLNSNSNQQKATLSISSDLIMVKNDEENPSTPSSNTSTGIGGAPGDVESDDEQKQASPSEQLEGRWKSQASKATRSSDFDDDDELLFFQFNICWFIKRNSSEKKLRFWKWMKLYIL